MLIKIMQERPKNNRPLRLQMLVAELLNAPARSGTLVDAKSLVLDKRPSTKLKRTMNEQTGLRFLLDGKMQYLQAPRLNLSPAASATTTTTTTTATTTPTPPTEVM